jgi:hypothetical protein
MLEQRPHFSPLAGGSQNSQPSQRFAAIKVSVR